MALVTYQDFLQRVDELGFMALSTLSHVLPTVSEETQGGSWHTGDPNTDPWQWKDRAAQEKTAAYGCILGGHKGFVSARLYALFYAACHPLEPMEERWESGEVSQTTWQLWQLFEKMPGLSTSDIRREMGVTAKRGGSVVDASIRQLQCEYYITVAGNTRKVDRNGKPYGWSVCVYDRVADWAPTDWMTGMSGIEPRNACEKILDIGMAMGKCTNRRDLAKALGLG